MELIDLGNDIFYGKSNNSEKGRRKWITGN